MIINYRLCPICLVTKIYRREVRTCGSSACLNIWRKLGVNERINAVTNAHQHAITTYEKDFHELMSKIKEKMS